MKVVIALDGSPASQLVVDDSKHAEAAISVVANYFKPQTTEVKLLHVLTPITLSALPQMARGYAPEMERQGTQAHVLLDKYAQQLRAQGYKVDSAIEIGDVCETVIDLAARWSADLIVLGSRGHRGMDRLLLGSVTESVVRHAHCSVLVVRLPANQGSD